MTSVRALPVPPGAAALRLLPDLERALAGSGPLLAPYAAGTTPPDLPEAADVPPGGVAIGTSGSTGESKRAVLTARALRASADATATRLSGASGSGHGGDGWLLALPAAHIAGLQVLLRALRAGTTPLAMPEGPFSAEAFARATGELVATGATRRYVSLVPAQLTRLLGDADGVAALTAYDAVLVGGSATDATMLDRAREAGARVITTYGMSETAGGCVYDGHPLDGVRVRLEEGRIILSGPMLAAGYLADPERSAAAFDTDAEGVWFRTDDLGHLDGPLLVVDGRIDDVIITGGYKVNPTLVEAALARVLPAGARAVVVGVPDPRWGHAVAAVVATGALAAGDSPPGADPILLDGLRTALAGTLPAYAVPTRLVTVADLPFLGPGKPDRERITRLVVRD